MNDWRHNLLPDSAQQALMFAAEDDRQRARDPIFDAQYRIRFGTSTDLVIKDIKRKYPEYFREESQ